MVLSLKAVTDASSNSSSSYLAAHQFLFISGWPQSGTSLMQQIFTVAPHTSTMVQRCSEKISGGKCLDWNFEGQWILKFSEGAKNSAKSTASSLMNPGSICQSHLLTEPGISSISNVIESLHSHQNRITVSNNLLLNSTDYKNSLLNTALIWEKFWNLEKLLLVEKSPHTMLKSDHLRAIFSEAKSVKFIIVIKVCD